MQTRTAQVNGVTRRWIEQGDDGPPVVCVHGIPTSPALWRHVLPLLSGRVLAPEMVGYGDSVPAGEGRDVSVAEQATYLLDWLDHLEIDRAVLVGHDLGGGVVQIAAVRRPEVCAGLLLTNAIGYDSWPIPMVKALRAASPVVARIPGVLMPANLAPLMLRGHDDLRRARESWRVHARPYREYGGAALARQVTSLDVQDTLAVADRLPELQVPARVVWGTADQFQKVRYGERFAADLGTTLRRIEGGKHFTPEDHPDVLAEEINGLVAEVQRG